MYLKREKSKIYLIEKDKVLFETGYLGADFIVTLSTNDPIVITKELDKYLYLNLKDLLENEYVFDNNNLSYKEGNKIVWFSDQYCDIEDENSTNMVNRLIIEKTDNKIKLSYENPFFKKFNIRKCNNVIAFFPCGNGFYSKNINTGLSFQDDIVMTFYKILTCEFEKPEAKVVIKKTKKF